MVRPPRTKKNKARSNAGLAGPLLAALLAMAAFWLGQIQGGATGLDPSTPSETPGLVTVTIPEEHRALIDSWPRFVACYGLSQDQQVVAATLRANGFPRIAFTPNRPIRVVLQPSSSGISPDEEEVLREAKALSDRRDGGTNVCPR